jgi:hypothetical protein
LSTAFARLLAAIGQIGNSLFDASANQAPGITAANPVPRAPFQFDAPSIVQRTQTHELRISSETPIAGFLDYTAGAFFRHTKNQVNVVQLASFLPGSFGSTLAPPNPGFYDPKYTLQVAPDGVRVAMIIRTGSSTRIQVAAISKRMKLSVPANTAPHQIRSMENMQTCAIRERESRE